MYTVLKECLACGLSNLRGYLALGDQPLANSYRKEKDAAEYLFPLEANFCTTCSHSQLSIAVDPEIMYKNYLYVSGTTQTLKDFFDGIAQDALKYTIPKVNNRFNVLDIGSNDGTLLDSFLGRNFKEAKINTVGVDPAENLADNVRAKGHTHISAFWSKNIDLRQEFDIITACNVLAHQKDPVGFLEAARRHLVPCTGRIVVVFPYSLKTFLGNQVDQFYHEHINYFNATSIYELARRVNLYVADIYVKPIHGGSLVVTLAPAVTSEEKWFKPNAGLNALMENEREVGMRSLDFHKRFTGRCYNNLVGLGHMLESAYDRGQRVVGYGASAKCTVVLNALRGMLRQTDHIYSIVDDNPLKHGHYVPGTNIQISSPQWLVGHEGFSIPCFAWNFADEIKRRLGDKHDLYTYVPEIRTL